jgi:hypothetical protein
MHCALQEGYTDQISPRVKRILILHSNLKMEGGDRELDIQTELKEVVGSILVNELMFRKI